MIRYHCVTTMNAAGWRETGRRMAESFVARWPSTARLTVYAEGFAPAVRGIDVRRLPAWLDVFKAAHGDDPKRTGRGGPVRPYDYRFDAVKFAHKSAALTDFGLGLGDGVMIWLDADTFTHAEVTADWLDGLFPAGAYLAWLERRNSHPETGFVMFRASHPEHHAVMGALEDLYLSGEMFALGETHDAALLHHVAMGAASRGAIPRPHNLSGDATGWHHPFIAGPLGACLEHAKGERKRQGHSRARDLRTPRPEPYWQEIARRG